MPKKRFVSGVVDPITIIGVLFLIITLSIGTYVVSDKKYNFNIFEKAGIDGGLDTLSGNSSGQNFGTTGTTNDYDPQADRNAKLDAQRRQQAKADDGSEQPQTPTETVKPKFADGCDVNGTKLEVGANVVGGANIAGTNFKGTSGYATCDANLGWVDCLTCNDQNLTVLPIYIENELEAACSNSGKTWDGVSKTCNDSQTQANNTPITIGQQDANAPYISLSDTVRDEEVKKNNLAYQLQQVTINPKITTTNSNSLDGVNIGGGTSKKIQTADQYIKAISQDIVDKLLEEAIPGWSTYTNPNNYNFNQNLFTNKKVTQKDGTPTIQQASYCGRSGLTQEQRDECTNIARVSAYNNPITSGYLQAYSPQNVMHNYDQMGYDSVSDCVEGEQTYMGKQLCNGYQITKNQVTSSVSLGTDIASVITLPAAPAIFGTKSLLMFGLGTFGGTMTVQQTKNAVVAQIEDPGFFKSQENINPVGFWESIDPQTYLTDAGYQTTMAALGWFNLDSANKLMRAWGPAGNAILQQSARVYNTVVSTANLYVDTPYAVNKCTQSGLISSECGYASIAPVFDVVFGGLDYYQGQLTLNPIRAITEAADSIVPSLVNVDGLRNNPLGEIQIPIKFNTSPIPIDYSLSGLDGQIGGWPTNFDNISTYIKNEPYLPNSNNGDMLFSPYQQHLSAAEVNEIELTREQIENLTAIEIQKLNPTPKLALTEPDPNIIAQIDLNSSEGNILRNIQVAPEVVGAGEVGRTTTQISWRGFINEVGQLQFPIQTRQINIEEIVPTTPITTRISDRWDDSLFNWKNWSSPFGGGSPATDPVSKVGFKTSESTNKLVAYIVGGDISTTPKLSEKMKLDQMELQNTLGFPPVIQRFNDPKTYLDNLLILAKEKNIEINIKSDNIIRQENGAIYLQSLDHNKDIDLSRLTHELTHAIEVKIKGGEFDIEMMEYHAYLMALGDPVAVEKALGDDFVEFFFGGAGVRGSVEKHYKDLGIEEMPWLVEDESIKSVSLPNKILGGVKNWWEGLKQGDNKIIQFFISPKERGSLAIPLPYTPKDIDVRFNENAVIDSSGTNTAKGFLDNEGNLNFGVQPSFTNIEYYPVAVRKVGSEYQILPTFDVGRAIQGDSFYDATISSNHGQILLQPDGTMKYRDTGSLNGSFYRNPQDSEFIRISLGEEIVVTRNTEIRLGEDAGNIIRVNNNTNTGKIEIVNTTTKNYASYNKPPILDISRTNIDDSNTIQEITNSKDTPPKQINTPDPIYYKFESENKLISDNSGKYKIYITEDITTGGEGKIELGAIENTATGNNIEVIIKHALSPEDGQKMVNQYLLFSKIEKILEAEGRPDLKSRIVIPLGIIQDTNGNATGYIRSYTRGRPIWEGHGKVNGRMTDADIRDFEGLFKILDKYGLSPYDISPQNFIGSPGKYVLADITPEENVTLRKDGTRQQIGHFIDKQVINTGYIQRRLKEGDEIIPDPTSGQFFYDTHSSDSALENFRLMVKYQDEGFVRSAIKPKGQTLIEFSTIMPVVLAVPLYYLDQYFDWGIFDKIKDVLFDNPAAKSLGVALNTNNLSILKPLTPILPLLITTNFENINYIPTIDQPTDIPDIEIAPEGLTSYGNGECTRNGNTYCDGERMYDLYLWYKNQPDGWWQDGDFTPADFLAMMLVAESTGGDPELLKSIMVATANQLWGSSDKHRPYCTTPDCAAGIFNFLGDYVQSAGERYNGLISNDGSPSQGTLRNLASGQEVAEYFAQNGLSIDQIANDVIYDPISSEYNNDAPTQWGVTGCGKNCEGIEIEWLKNLNNTNGVEYNTTDRCGIYDSYGLGNVQAVVYTNNQMYNWSLEKSPCVNN